MSKPDGPRPNRQIPVDALMGGQQDDQQRRRRRVIAVTAATLAATGVVGGVAIGMLADDEDSAQPAAQSTATTAPPTDEATESTQIPSPSAPRDDETNSGTMGESLPSGEPEAAPTPPPATEAPAAPERHVVVAGESMWSITADLLGPGATAEQIVDSWPQLYEANRGTIGSDPNLIVIGQELTLPALT